MNIRNTRTSFWCFYCELSTYFTPFSSVLSLEAVVRRCSSKKVFLKISQSLFNQLAGLSAFYRTPSVAASGRSFFKESLISLKFFPVFAFQSPISLEYV